MARVGAQTGGLAGVEHFINSSERALFCMSLTVYRPPASTHELPFVVATLAVAFSLCTRGSGSEPRSTKGGEGEEEKKRER